MQICISNSFHYTIKNNSINDPSQKKDNINHIYDDEMGNIENPISVARKVMEDTPHVMLSGKGAYDFAIQKKFKHNNNF